ncbi:MAG: hypothetical protein JEZ03_18605 [Bacteroidales bacterium]|nr:hypothetical protein [Bacteroidales bacterium]
MNISMRNLVWVMMLILGLMIVNGAWAQSDTKCWSEGELLWSDFKGEPESQRKSVLSYYTESRSGRMSLNDTVYNRYLTKVFIDRDLSWIHPEFKTDLYLEVNQLMFDIVELYRRRMQYDLDRVYNGYTAQRKSGEYFDSCNERISSFYNESSAGEVEQVVKEWKQVISDELAVVGDSKRPDFRISKFGYGMHLGIGCGSFAGSLAKQFGPSFNIIYGFDFSYMKSILFIDATIGFNQIKKEYVFEEGWRKGQGGTVAILNVSYAYKVFDNGELRLSPFAGFGLTEVGRSNNSPDLETLSMVDYKYIFGLNADYPLKRVVNLIPTRSLGRKEFIEAKIRARLYVSRANFAPDLKGYSINLSLSMGISGNAIRMMN